MAKPPLLSRRFSGTESDEISQDDYVKTMERAYSFDEQ
jgi:hypothetical protein